MNLLVWGKVFFLAICSIVNFIGILHPDTEGARFGKSKVSDALVGIPLVCVGVFWILEIFKIHGDPLIESGIDYANARNISFILFVFLHALIGDNSDAKKSTILGCKINWGSFACFIIGLVCIWYFYYP